MGLAGAVRGSGLYYLFGPVSATPGQFVQLHVVTQTHLLCEAASHIFSTHAFFQRGLVLIRGERREMFEGRIGRQFGGAADAGTAGQTVDGLVAEGGGLLGRCGHLDVGVAVEAGSLSEGLPQVTTALQFDAIVDQYLRVGLLLLAHHDLQPDFSVVFIDLKNLLRHRFISPVCVSERGSSWIQLVSYRVLQLRALAVE